MTQPVFYVAHDALLDASAIRLDGPEGRHGAAVRRLRVGESVCLSDGRGNVAEGTVSSVERTAFTVDVATRTVVPPPQPRIVVVQALPKGDHAELAVSLLTQIGVDEVVPWSAERCVARWTDDRAGRGVAKWRATAHEAAKQARRVWWPEVGELADTSQVCGRVSAASAALVLHENASDDLAGVAPPDNGDIVLVVGPEGGITDAELDRLTSAGATPLRAGPTVLRTSSAGAVGAAVVLARTSRWSTQR